MTVRNKWLKLSGYSRLVTTDELRQLGIPNLGPLKTRQQIRQGLEKFRRIYFSQPGISTNIFSVSRFTSLSGILKKHLQSCGALATVAASVFRTYGVPVKLVDGWYRGKKEKNRHAWTEIWVSEEKIYIPFDVTRQSMRVGKKHKPRKRYSDWSILKKEYKSDN